MPTILPVSSLRSYTEVLDRIAPGAPVFLTKNGHGRYAVLDMGDYDRLSAEERLLSTLELGRKAGEEQGWIPAEDVHARFVKQHSHAS